MMLYDRQVKPDVGPLKPFMRGVICRLAERLWFLTILCVSAVPAVPLLMVSSAALSLAPIDIIDTERL